MLWKKLANLTRRVRLRLTRSPFANEVHLHLPFEPDPTGFPDAETLDRMFALEDELEAALSAARAGGVEGHEIGGNECIMFLFGPNADRLCDRVLEVLDGRTLRPGSYAIKRYGSTDDDEAREIRVSLA